MPSFRDASPRSDRPHRLPANPARLAAILVAGLLVGSLAAQGSRPTPQVKAGPAAVLTRIVDAASGAPLFGATVTLAETPPLPGQLTAQTDAQGLVSFRGIATGRYHLSAKVPGYLAGSAEASASLDSRTETVIVIPLWKHGALAGIVLDEGGSGVRGATVVALRWESVSGEQKVVTQSVTTTNPEGRFRLAGLPSGEYVVWLPSMAVTVPKGPAGARATPPPQVAPYFLPHAETAVPAGFILWTFGVGKPNPQTSGPIELFEHTFWPEATAPSLATRIVLASGEERTNLEFRPKRRPGRTVSGRVFGDERVASQLPVHLMSSTAGEFAIESEFKIAAAITDERGQFQFAAVPQGNYQLQILAQGRPDFSKVPQGWMVERRELANGGFDLRMIGPRGETSPLPSGSGLVHWSNAPLAVGASDIGNVGLTLLGGVRLSGTVTCDATSADVRFETIRLNLEALDGLARGRGSAAQGTVDAQGRIEAPSLAPGAYYLRVSGIPEGWFLKAIQLGGSDSLERPVTVSADRADLSVVLTRAQSRVQGTVSPRSGESPGDFFVAAFPTDRTLWRGYGRASGRLNLAAINANWSYALTGLPSGSYFVAVTRNPVDNWRQPQNLAVLSGGASTISIGPGDVIVRNLETRRTGTSGRRLYQAEAPSEAESDPSPVRTARRSRLHSSNASLTGIVVTRDDNLRQSDVRLILQNAATSVTLQTSTDGGGQFAFSQVPAGTWQLTASKRGLVTTAFGSAALASRLGTPITLIDGQADELVVRVSKGASIHGTVRGLNGALPPPVQVRLIPSVAREGRLVLSETLQAPDLTTTTDENGNYRFDSLAPAAYVVAAVPTGDAALRPSSVSPDTAAAMDHYLPTYLPGTSVPSDALPLEVLEGSNQTVDIALLTGKFGQARLKVAAAEHGGVQDVNVAVLWKSVPTALQPLIAASAAERLSDGVYNLTRLRPGRYFVAVRAAPASTGRNENRTGVARRPLSASTEFSIVNGEDIGELVLELRLGVTVSGRAVMRDHLGERPAREIGVSVRRDVSAGGVPPAPLASTRTAGDGSFVFEGVAPGRYELALTNEKLLPDWCLTTATADGPTASSALQFEVTEGRGVSNLTMALLPATSRIRGVARDSGVADRFVVLFPSDSRIWPLMLGKLPMPVRPSRTGEFEFAGLPAGDYRLAVVNTVNTVQWYDFAELRHLRESSYNVQVRPGETVIVSITSSSFAGVAGVR